MRELTIDKRLSPEDLAAFRAEWQKSHQGLANARQIVTIGGSPLSRVALSLRLWIARWRAARYA